MSTFQKGSDSLGQRGRGRCTGPRRARCIVLAHRVVAARDADVERNCHVSRWWENLASDPHPQSQQQTQGHPHKPALQSKHGRRQIPPECIHGSCIRARKQKGGPYRGIGRAEQHAQQVEAEQRPADHAEDGQSRLRSEKRQGGL